MSVPKNLKVFHLKKKERGKASNKRKEGERERGKKRKRTNQISKFNQTLIGSRAALYINIMTRFIKCPVIPGVVANAASMAVLGRPFGGTATFAKSFFVLFRF